MSESASALFSIADAREFRFARFYIVCEEVPLGTPESPPIVSGVSDMHPSDCPNVEETRNPMQTFSRKKCSHFSPTNFHLHFHLKSHDVIFFLIILLINANTIYLLRQFQKNRQKHPRCFCLPISTSLLNVDLRLYAEFVLILLQYRIYNICKECIHLYRCASDILGRLHGCLQLL